MFVGDISGVMTYFYNYFPISKVVHPILFLARAFMEYYFDGFRNGMKLYFENPAAGEPLEYPSSVLNSEGPLELIV